MPNAPKSPKITLRFMAAPTDVLMAGSHGVGGGRVLEWIDKAAVEGAQSITRHGRPVAVVVSAETYSRLQPAETLADILLDCPVKDWGINRDKEVARDLEFD